MTKGPFTSLLDLPNELLVLIVEYIDDFQHLYAFLITNRRLATLLATPLYRLAARSGFRRGLTALLWTIATKNEPMLRVLLSSPGFRKITIKGQAGALLHQLSPANAANAESIAMILSEGVAINVRVGKGRRSSREGPALHWAAKIGDEALARLLLDRGANIDARDRYGHTALHCAATTGQIAVVKLLLRRGADRLAVGSFGDKPLDRARSYHHMDVVMVLLEGADVTERYRNRITPLRIAAEIPDDDFAAIVVKSLLEQGADVAGEPGGYLEMTPPYIAVRGGNEKVVRLLVEAGAWELAHPSHGYSLIDAAMDTQRYKIARFLIETAPVDHVSIGCHSLLHRALKLPSADTTLVSLLLEKGVPVNNTCCLLNTPLHSAIGRGQREIVTLLLRHRAEVNLRNHTNSTALILAAAGIAWQSHDKYIVQSNRGTCDDMLYIARLLLHNDAEIDAQDDDGRTALHHAVIAGGEAMVILLLEAGADPSLVDSGWQTPMELARGKITNGPGEAAIFRVLEERTVGHESVGNS